MPEAQRDGISTEPHGSPQDQVSGLHRRLRKPVSGGGLGAGVGVGFSLGDRTSSTHHLTENAFQAGITTLTL